MVRPVLDMIHGFKLLLVHFVIMYEIPIYIEPSPISSSSTTRSSCISLCRQTRLTSMSSLWGLALLGSCAQMRLLALGSTSGS
jgi:hypothetical protein